MMMWTVISGMLIPVVMMACYPFFTHAARGEPSSWAGYRTARAMASTRNWREANALAAQYWLRTGALVLVVVGLGVMAGALIPIQRRLAAMDRDLQGGGPGVDPR